MYSLVPGALKHLRGRVTRAWNTRLGAKGKIERQAPGRKCKQDGGREQPNGGSP